MAHVKIYPHRYYGVAQCVEKEWDKVAQSGKLKLVVIGGVALGAGVAAKARRISEAAEIVVLERGEYVSFANCGLPYFLGDVIKNRDALLLHTPQSLFDRFNLDVRVLHEVVSIDRAAHTVRVHDLVRDEVYEQPYDKLVLAAGATPIAPRLPGRELAGIFSVREVPDVDRMKAWIAELPVKSAAVIGGGFIGLEVVENLHHLGLEVTLIEKASQVLPPFDVEMTIPVLRHLRDLGVRVVLDNGISAFSGHERAESVTLESGEVVSADLFVMSLGVRPDTGLARDAGLALGVSGAVHVNHELQTSDPDIFAGGDIAELRYDLDNTPRWIALAGAANKQARIIAENLFGAKQQFSGAHGTSIVQVGKVAAAMTGWSERAAAAAGLNYLVSYNTAGHHAGYYPGAEDLTIKLVIDRATGKLLGAQVVGGAGVDKRIDVLSVALSAGLTVTDLTHLDLAYAPPFSSAKDPVIMAAMAAENLVRGETQAVVDWIGEDSHAASGGNVRLLDVRRSDEVRDGMLPGAVHIPLDELRQRIGELDPNVDWIVYCRSGQRSYFATRLLKGMGFRSVRNLSGGYTVAQMKGLVSAL